jgi:hypothetical protein
MYHREALWLAFETASMYPPQPKPGVYYLRLRHYRANATGKCGIYVAASA